MSTATMNPSETLSRLSELQQEAASIQQDYDQKMATVMSQIAEAATGVASANGTPARANATRNSAPAPARRRQNSAPQPAARQNPQKGSKKGVRKVAGKVQPSQRNYSNEMSLKQAIWDVLDRNPDDWDKLISGLPKDAEGLGIAEIKEIIDTEKKWVSASANISPQLQSQLYQLKKDGKVARSGDGRYFIIDGQTLDK